MPEGALVGAWTKSAHKLWVKRLRRTSTLAEFLQACCLFHSTFLLSSFAYVCVQSCVRVIAESSICFVKHVISFYETNAFVIIFSGSC